jgi:tetratricopeptide (TPR) repeat protein
VPTPTEIADPCMRKAWQQAKKNAETKAKAKKQEKAYQEFEKGFDLELGPSLAKWPSNYPNTGALRTKMIQIDTIIGKYEKRVKEAKGSLDKTVLEELKTGLVDARDQLATRLAIAVSLLEADEDLALKQAIKESKSPLKPVVVFKHPDLSEIIMAKAPKTREHVEINKLEIEVILSDSKVLGRVDDRDGDMAQKIKDAGDFKQLRKDILAAYLKAAVTVRGDRGKFKQANATFEKEFEDALEAAVGRASEELHRLAKVRVDYRNYKIKSGAQLGLTIAGATAAAVSIGLAPFSGPAMAISLLGAIRGAVSAGKQIALLSMQAEELINRVKANLKDLNKRYETWSGAQIGGAEVGVTLVNAIAPTFFSTIKNVGSECDQIGDKINGIEVQAGDVSIALNEAIDYQEELKATIKDWIKDNRMEMSPKLQKSFTAMLAELKKNEVAVGKLVNEVGTLNERVKKAGADQKKLSRSIAALSAREPTAAKFAEVFVEVGASVGFLVAANVGWPNAYDIAASTKAVVDGIGNAAGVADGLKGMVENVKGEVDNLRK